MDRSVSSAASGIAGLSERVHWLEVQTAALTEAVDMLARGLESNPMAEPRNRHIEEAARRTHELLLLAKSAAPGGRPGEGRTGA